MAKRPVPLYDFKAFGAAIKAARNEYGESRKKVSDELYISPRYLANIENKGQQPSLQVFYDLVTRYHISVDQFFFPNSNAEKSTGRRQLDALLDGVIRIKSEGYEPFTVKLSDVSTQSGKTGTAAIVCGIAAKFMDMGVEIGGFDLYCTSDVLCGSGISSSAAFETLIGTIIDSYYNDNKAGAVEIAKIGQFAENVYFGKNSGLMDQMVSSVGGLVFIDFSDTEQPKVEGFSCDFEEYGYCLCITDTKSSHADLTDDYTAIRNEMENIAKHFGKSHMRFVNELLFYNEIPKLRETCSDRAIIRATHFFEENNRAKFEVSALKDGNFEYFLELVRQSGRSSEAYLQNHYSCSDPENQAITLAVMLSRRFLGNSGAVRVHGGGFAGTIQAFVPVGLVDDYINEMNRIFGEKSCTKMKIRPIGGVEITKE